MKCPKCKKEVKEVYIEQKLLTYASGTLREKGKGYEKDLDIEVGYTLLNEWIDNMLVEQDEPTILGCKNCIK